MAVNPLSVISHSLSTSAHIISVPAQTRSLADLSPFILTKEDSKCKNKLKPPLQGLNLPSNFCEDNSIKSVNDVILSIERVVSKVKRVQGRASTSTPRPRVSNKLTIHRGGIASKTSTNAKTRGEADIPKLQTAPFGYNSTSNNNISEEMLSSRPNQSDDNRKEVGLISYQRTMSHKIRQTSVKELTPINHNGYQQLMSDISSSRSTDGLMTSLSTLSGLDLARVNEPTTSVVTRSSQFVNRRHVDDVKSIDSSLGSVDHVTFSRPTCQGAVNHADVNDVTNSHWGDSLNSNTGCKLTVDLSGCGLSRGPTTGKPFKATHSGSWLSPAADQLKSVQHWLDGADLTFMSAPLNLNGPCASSGLVNRYQTPRMKNDYSSEVIPLDDFIPTSGTKLLNFPHIYQQQHPLMSSVAAMSCQQTLSSDVFDNHRTPSSMNYSGSTLQALENNYWALN